MSVAFVGARPAAAASGGERAAPPRPWVATLFGRFGVTDAAGEPIGLPRSRKATALLATVATAQPRPVTRDRLMGLLWGDRGEEQARGSLRQALAEIRAAPVAPAITIGRHDVAFTLDRIQTDAMRIEAAAAARDLPGLAALTRGLDEHVLDGLDDIDPAFDDWLRTMRENLIAALTARLLPALGSVGHAQELAEQRVVLSALQRLNPMDEASLRLALLLDHRAGDLAALHRRYRLLTETLRRTYDAAPSGETVALFRRLTAVAPIRDQPVAEAADRSGAAEPPVVVLVPLDLAGGSAGEAALASICLADLEIALSGVADLRLLSLDDPSPETLRAACGVAVASFVLRGSFHVVGNDVRLGWRLQRIDDGRLIWSQRAVEPRANLGRAMEDIVARVAGAVLPAVERDLDQRAATAGGGRNADGGYEHYLRGRALHLFGPTLADKQEAARHYERAIRLAPRLVYAHLNLARLYNTDFEQMMAGHDPAPLRSKAFELCARAVTIDPGSAQARSRLGWCYMRRGDTRQSRQRFQEALTLSPYHADCLNEIGFGLLHLGDLDEGGRLLACAFALNPFPNADYFCDTGVLLMLRGQHAAAEEQFEVSTECARHYAAFRLANRGLLGGRDLAAECEALRASLRAIWIGGEAPSDAAMFALLLQYAPLQVAAHRDLLSQGLALAGMKVAG